LDFSGPVPHVEWGLDEVHRRCRLSFHPRAFVDVPGREQHLEFGGPADRDQAAFHQWAKDFGHWRLV
jgi:hypothetical protein